MRQSIPGKRTDALPEQGCWAILAYGRGFSRGDFGLFFVVCKEVGLESNPSTTHPGVLMAIGRSGSYPQLEHSLVPTNSCCVHILLSPTPIAATQG